MKKKRMLTLILIALFMFSVGAPEFIFADTVSSEENDAANASSEIVNVIEPLERNVSQGDKVIEKKPNTEPDTYYITPNNNKVIVDYRATMDMTKLNGVFGEDSWKTLNYAAAYGMINDGEFKNGAYSGTHVMMHFTFDPKLIVTEEIWKNAIFESDMFEYDKDRTTVVHENGYTNVTCNFLWNNEKVKKAIEGKELNPIKLNPIISIHGVPMEISKNWNGADTIKISNKGYVDGNMSGNVTGGSINVPINGGDQSDEFVLALLEEEKTPDENKPANKPVENKVENKVKEKKEIKTVYSSNSPQTGDEATPMSFLLIGIGASIALAVLAKKKKEIN